MTFVAHVTVQSCQIHSDFYVSETYLVMHTFKQGGPRTRVSSMIMPTLCTGKKGGGAFNSAKNHKRQRRKRQSVTAKRAKSQTPKFVKVRLGQVRLGQAKLGQVKLGQVRLALRIRPLAFATLLVWRFVGGFARLVRRIGACGVGACGFWRL